MATLTNGGSISSTYIFDSRLQPCWIYTTTGTALPWQNTGCSGTATTGTILDLKYNFNFGAGDNGNVIGIVNNRNTARSQNFEYDALNRISRAYSTGGLWGEMYVIDPWGNLANRGAVTGKTAYESLAVQPIVANNRLPQSSGFGYDVAGNMISNNGAQYVYDAENRIISAGGVTYTYDGDGSRVKKSSGTLYWGSGPLAESDLNASTTSWKEYVFFNGTRVARRDASNSSVHYFFSNHLGSTSVMTNSAGTTIEEDLDYFPYGGIAYGAASDHYEFTGKERDTESGLDNFGARYDASSLGRFMTPDPIAGSAWNPQSLNAYSYVWNNPLKLTDPSGMIVSWEDSKCTKQGSEAECKTYLQRKYEKKISDLLNSKDKKDQKRGKDLQATYEKLQGAEETFHVVREGGDGSGELVYKGEPGNLYVEMKGSGTLYGEMQDVQKIGHEFEHGKQFLEGLIGFIQLDNGKWAGYRDDLVDEANAFMAGFEAEPVGGDQSKFLQGLGQAANWGVNEVIKKLGAPGSPYQGRSPTQLDMTFKGGKVPPNVYAVPRTQ